MSDDWRFNDDRMQLRASVFRALQHHLDDHTRAVYEFCHDWVSQGNQNIDNIEFYFEEYLRDDRNTNVKKLEKCLLADSSEQYADRPWDRRPD